MSLTALLDIDVVVLLERLEWRIVVFTIDQICHTIQEEHRRRRSAVRRVWQQASYLVQSGVARISHGGDTATYVGLPDFCPITRHRHRSYQLGRRRSVKASGQQPQIRVAGYWNGVQPLHILAPGGMGHARQVLARHQ